MIRRFAILAVVAVVVGGCEEPPPPPTSPPPTPQDVETYMLFARVGLDSVYEALDPIYQLHAAYTVEPHKLPQGSNRTSALDEAQKCARFDFPGQLPGVAPLERPELHQRALDIFARATAACLEASKALEGTDDEAFLALEFPEINADLRELRGEISE